MARTPIYAVMEKAVFALTIKVAACVGCDASQEAVHEGCEATHVVGRRQSRS